MSDSNKPFYSIFTDTLTLQLACATITPGLRSILMFNSSPKDLRIAAELLSQMLEVVTNKSVTKVTLSTYESEDDLWGSLGISAAQEHPFAWKPGLLVDDSIRLVIIPDLTKLSLAAARACVAMIGSDVAHLERHGQQLHWQPNLCWLAGCTSTEVGMVSPHLLDRFALRLSGIIQPQDRVEEILSLINNQTLGAQPQIEPLSTEIKEILQKALQYRPQITNQAISKILYYALTIEVFSSRREIALARLSLANARLENAAEVTEEHVDTAAKMIGLKPVVQKQKHNKTSEIKKSESLENQNNKSSQSQPSNDELQINTINETLPIYESDELETLAPIPTIENLIDPYPEDSAPVEREIASLRLPSRRFQNKSIARGVIIGVEKAKNLQDIALVKTLLEAAKFQPVRQTATNGNKLLILSPTDLYSYRRAPVAEQMLTLVLDHTCLQDCQWQNELLPYLSWAYVERASVCLIQIGASNAKQELQAEKIMAQSILVPSINAGIETEAGKATPLAHGLDLALQTLRHTLQHGRSIIKQAMLVVITDGRGNIPLEASRTNRIIPPVGRKGVEDALQVAERIRGLDGVKAVLLNPQPQQYPEIPLELAKALGAKVILIPPQETWELE